MTTTTYAEFRAKIRAFEERARAADVHADLGMAPAAQAAHVLDGNVARTNLCRTVGFELVRAEGGGADDVESDGLNIEGYGAVFNSDTEINSWEGHFIERIRPGAFKKSLTEQTPKMQFDHGHHPLLGGLPLGRWTTAEEDKKGLHLAGRMYDNWLVQPFRDAIADGAVDGMSFRFGVVREEWRDKDGKKINDEKELFELIYFGAGDRGPLTRELVEVKVPEAGPVVWPAYKDTSVGARSGDPDGPGVITIDLGNRREVAEAIARMDSVAATSSWKIAAVQRADAALTRSVLHTGGVDTTPPVSAGGGDTSTTEPQATEGPADGHPERNAPAPPATEDNSAGTHSSSSQQAERRTAVNPTDRREQIRREYREILNRTLALPDS